MRKIIEFIENEEKSWGKLYSTISFAQNEIEPFVDQKLFRQRRYVTRLPVLSKYMDYLEKVKMESKKQGLMGFLKDNETIEMLGQFKKDHEEDLAQLQKCGECCCLKCPKECQFDSCLGCRMHTKVAQCDHETQNIILHENHIEPLLNNDSNVTEDFEVLATMQDLNTDKRYIFLQNVYNGDKLVLYFYPGISENSYGEITDTEEFDRVIGAYQSLDRG